MGYGKKEQFENKLNSIKNLLNSKANLKLILEHDEELKMRNHSFSGRLQYLTILKELSDFREKDFKQLTEKDLKEFFSRLKPFNSNWKSTEMSPKSKWIYMCLVKSFYKWLYNVEEGDPTPATVKWIVRRKYVGHNRKTMPSEILTREEVLALIEGANNTRDRAFLFGLYDSGCRAWSEFCQIKIGDMQIKDRYCTFDVKGDVKTADSERTCYFTKSWKAIKDWLEVHPRANAPNAYLWVSLRGATYGQQITKAVPKEIVERAVKNSGLKKKVYPHLLRKSKATHCAEEGYNNQTMCQIFGWSETSDMPATYIRLGSKQVKNVVLAKNGLAKESQGLKKEFRKLDTIVCPRCKEEWAAGTKYCTCGSILDEREALLKEKEIKVKEKGELMALKEGLEEMYRKFHEFEQRQARA